MEAKAPKFHRAPACHRTRRPNMRPRPEGTSQELSSEPGVRTTALGGGHPGAPRSLADCARGVGPVCKSDAVSESLCDVFFAYPGSSPLLTETMREAARKLDERTELSVRTWEGLRVDGRLIIGEVLRAIDSAS